MIKKSTYNVSFVLRKDKSLRNGEIPLTVRITMNGIRAEFNSKFAVKPEIWNSKKCKADGNSAYSRKINSYIDQLKISLYNSINDLEDRGVEITPENIKNNYLGLIEYKQLTLFSLYEEHNQRMNSLIGKTYAFSTLQKHLTTVEHLKSFVKSKYDSSDILIDKLNSQFIIDFEYYLKSEKDISNNTTIKYLKNLRKIVKIALNVGYLKKDPFAAVRYHQDEVERPFLDKHELERLIEKVLPNQRLGQIKDIFIFCCFTGLAFADVQALTEDCLYTTKSSDDVWIKKRRQKTKKWFHIPLLPQAKRILIKYSTHACRKKGLLLPVPTNQKMNAYLKEIADLTGINKNLTTHCARHTFATTVTLANGVSMESVSKMLGHSSILMTKQYARILDETISKEMSMLKEKL